MDKHCDETAPTSRPYVIYTWHLKR